MNILHFDSLGGAAGDMILGAFVDLGIKAAALQKELAKLPIGPFAIEATKTRENLIAGTRLMVRIPPGTVGRPSVGGDIPPGTEARLTSAGSVGGAKTERHHHGRGIGEIRAIIEKAALPDPVKSMSLRVFGRLAEAEAKVHGVQPEEVHFHEVGAVDAIVDIVGGCLGLYWLNVQAVSFSPLPLGHGIIECTHGTFPSPSPATVELLRGFPVEYVDEPHELVTPTGAALLTTWRSLETPPPGSRIVQVGHSYGHQALDHRPNLLRAMLLEAPGAQTGSDTCLVLECNVDDSTPELLGVLTERLIEAGALDVFTIPAQMKKQRPGVLLTVLCRPEDREKMLDPIFRESTTFGVREQLVARTILERRFAEVPTPYGVIRVKIGRWRGEDVTFAPELDTCRRAAREHGVPIRAVYEAACRAVPNPAR